MRIACMALAAAFGLAGCASEESVTKYGGGDYLWKLTEIDSVPVDYAAELAFNPDGSVSGEGPCNAFTALQSKPYPWVAIDIDVVEQIYCADINDEEAFLTALEEMTLVEVSGPNMVMSNDAGRSMVFRGS